MANVFEVLDGGMIKPHPFVCPWCAEVFERRFITSDGVEPRMKVTTWHKPWGAGLMVEFGGLWLEVRFNDLMGNVARWGLGGVEIGAWW